MAKLTGVKTLDMVGGEITKVAYNGAEYVKVDEVAQKGDLMRPNGKHHQGAIKHFEFYSVYTSNKYSASVIDDEGDNNGLSHRFYDTFRKIDAQPTPDLPNGSLSDRVSQLENRVDAIEQGETITHNGAEYTLVHRKAQPGDVVVFTENGNHYFTNGKAYGPVTSRMSARDNEGDYLSVYNGDKRSVENVKVYEPKQAKLKVGDYAKVVADVMEYTKGDIVCITSTKSSQFDFRVDKIFCPKANSHFGYIDAKDLVKATDAEVAEAKKKAAIAEKFAKLGRKPNEFKKGDIVRVLSSLYAKNPGEIFEVKSIDSDGDVFDEDGKVYVISNNRVELIAPVEIRVDVG